MDSKKQQHFASDDPADDLNVGGRLDLGNDNEDALKCLKMLKKRRNSDSNFLSANKSPSFYPHCKMRRESIKRSSISTAVPPLEALQRIRRQNKRGSLDPERKLRIPKR